MNKAVNYKKGWIFSIAFTLVLLEVLLRLAGVNETFAEQSGKEYFSNYKYQEVSKWHVGLNPDSSGEFSYKEFSFPFTTNEMGLVEKPLSAFTNCSGFKIVTLGDSYTQGIGTAYQNAWPRLLERKINEEIPQTCLFNAGLMGSDPFFEYVLYRDKLSHTNPNLVIFALNATDIDEFIYRGGMERFKADSTVSYNSAPWTEPLFHYSFIAREICKTVFDKDEEVLLSEEEIEVKGNDFVKQNTENFSRLKKTFGDSSNLLIVIFPGPYECLDPKYRRSPVAYRILKKLSASLIAQKVGSIDLYPLLKQELRNSSETQYGYKHDGHYNPWGYELFASHVFREMKKKYPNFIKVGNR